MRSLIALSLVFGFTLAAQAQESQTIQKQTELDAVFTQNTELSPNNQLSQQELNQTQAGSDCIEFIGFDGSAFELCW